MLSGHDFNDRINHRFLDELTSQLLFIKQKMFTKCV